MSNTRIFTIVAALLLVIAAAGAVARLSDSGGVQAASHSSLSLSVQLTADEVRRADQLFQNALVAYVGEPVVAAAAPAMITVQPASDYPPIETLTVYYIARLSRTPATVIIQERQRGRSWVAIARTHDVPESYYGRWVEVSTSYKGHDKNHGHGHAKVGATMRRFVPYSDAEFERQAFVVFTRDYYGVNGDQVQLWLSQGFSYPEVVLLLNYSRRARVEPATLVALRQDGLGWAVITRRYGVSFAQAVVPVEPKIELNLHFEWHN
ncbi:MAG: hypothetical protein IMX01_08130 [Limnochordaceae bacterium]|nr:hypothetical protein [Limnochordaceae bacterium]